MKDGNLAILYTKELVEWSLVSVVSVAITCMTTLQCLITVTCVSCSHPDAGASLSVTACRFWSVTLLSSTDCPTSYSYLQ
jgi:hypothetical protein